MGIRFLFGFILLSSTEMSMSSSPINLNPKSYLDSKDFSGENLSEAPPSKIKTKKIDGIKYYVFGDPIRGEILIPVKKNLTIADVNEARCRGSNSVEHSNGKLKMDREYLNSVKLQISYVNHLKDFVDSITNNLSVRCTSESISRILYNPLNPGVGFGVKFKAN